MTPAEIRQACIDLAAKVGPKADVRVDIRKPYRFAPSKELISGWLYPNGIGDGGSISVQADDWFEVFNLLSAKWDEVSADHARATIREIALKIIAITADTGACTDAELRQHFAAEDIERFGDRAVEQANEMADKGPFSIIATTGANAPADGVAA